LALGAFADSVAGQGRKIKEKRIATAMETLALVYELSERFDRAGSRPRRPSGRRQPQVRAGCGIRKAGRRAIAWRAN